MDIASRVAHVMLSRESTGPAWGVREAREILVAEAQELALVGRSGVYTVDQVEDGRAVAALQGCSRSLGGSIVEEGLLDD